MIEQRGEHNRVAAAPASGMDQQISFDAAALPSTAIFYIVTLGRKPRTRFISSNVERITGHKPEAFLANPDFGARQMHRDDYSNYTRQLRRLEDLGSLTLEYRFATAGGAYRWFRDELQVIDTSEAEKEFVGRMVDITEEREARFRGRQEANQQCRRAERLRDAVESLPTGFVIFDCNDRVVMTNQSQAFHGGESRRPEAVLGQTRDVVALRALSQIVWFDDEAVSQTKAAARKMSDRVRDLSNESVEFQRADGTWQLLSGHRTTEGGQVVITVDITRQKLQEIELRQARQTLEDAIESLSEGFVLYDPEDRIVICNTRFRELNGPCAEMLRRGTPRHEIIAARVDRGLFAGGKARVQSWLKSLESLRRSESDAEFELADGRWIHLSHRKTRQGGMVHTWRDISERKRMEIELRASEERVRQVLEACPVAITMNRANDGVIIYESPAAQALLGYERPQEGKSVVQRWIDPGDRQDYLRQLRLFGAIDGLEVRYRKFDGQEFPCAISSRLIEWHGEEVIVSNIFDLSERRAAETELERQRELLHQSEKLSALGELLAGVAHELNNPLSVMVGQAMMLQETAPDGDIWLRAERLTKAANRCAQIVQTFLTMARQEPGEIEPVKLNDLVDSALDVTAYALRTSDVEVSLRLAEDLPAVSGDAGQLRHVLINIIINAQHALQEVRHQRKLRISTAYVKKSDEVVFKIKDNGPGIPDEIRGRIFEPLYTTKDVGKGTGIGLALCHRIVNAHGGTIEVESSPKQGAVFVVRLPCVRRGGKSRAELKPKPERDGALQVLVVDDEPDVAETILDILEADGHVVDIVVSGRLALEMIKTDRYDVILSDLRMPELDGPGLYRALAKAHPRCLEKLAFITGDTLSPDVKDFLEASERPFLEKPITPTDLRELIDLQTRRGRR